MGPDFFAPRGRKFDLEKDIPDLSQQVYIVTGASTGLGFAITAQLLKHNAAKIITLSSRQEPALAAIEKLRAYGDVSRVLWRQCNLGSLKQTDQIARQLLEGEPRIDGLVLNAAVGITKFALSKDGIDRHFQVNVLAQLHLALTLLPVLQQTSKFTGIPARLVFMTSATHHYTPESTRFDSVEELNQDLGQQAHYYRSKLAQILIVRELTHRLHDGTLSIQDSGVVTTLEKLPLARSPSEQHVLINATHPGDYNKTPLTDNLEVAFGFWGWVLLLLLSPFMSDPMTQGCRPALFACTPNEELLARRLDGQYIVPDKRVVEPSATARDPEMGKRCWDLCVGLLKEKLELEGT